MSASTRGAALELQGLVKRYGESKAVDGISMTIPAGEFVTLLGPSGSGKTTTLNMIAGFANVDEGEILMDGRAIAEVPSHKRNLGIVFQHYALFPHMTAEDNVAFSLKQRKVPKAERRKRVKHALDMVQLGEFAERYPRQLSGGQQQRVALARALVFEPRVLLMDEPLGALDKKLREWLQLEFKRIHKELGITFVYVTHDQEEALVLSDRIAVFNDGRIEQVGSATDLYERPETLFVAEFIGESNCFSGRASRNGEAGRLIAGDLDLKVPAPGDDLDGVDASVIVRPERLEIRRPDSVLPADANVVGGRVHQVIYLGSSRKTEISMDDGRVLTVREPAARGDAIREGEPVEAFWSAADSVLVEGGSDGE